MNPQKLISSVSPTSQSTTVKVWGLGSRVPGFDVSGSAYFLALRRIKACTSEGGGEEQEGGIGGRAPRPWRIL